MTDMESDLVEARVHTMPFCDFHDHCTAQYDFKTTSGPWGNGCENAFREYGIGLGTGLGQKLVLSG
jgi:hypothetical protein